MQIRSFQVPFAEIYVYFSASSVMVAVRFSNRPLNDSHSVGEPENFGSSILGRFVDLLAPFMEKWR